MHKKTALITGATSGIGAAFAKKFASQNYDLIITGRREEKIKAFAHELTKKYNVNVEVIIAELSKNDVLEVIAEKIRNTKSLEILVNNAGYAEKRCKFTDASISAHENMLNVHCLATMKFVHAALPNMLANKKGLIINVSSPMGFFPFCMQSMYASTKAFIALFTESLNLELNGTGVKAQVLSPGVTYSDLHGKLEIDERKKARSSAWLWQSPMQPETVVEKSLKCLEKNRVLCIPGFRNKLVTIFHNLKRFF